LELALDPFDPFNVGAALDPFDLFNTVAFGLVAFEGLRHFGGLDMLK